MGVELQELFYKFFHFIREIGAERDLLVSRLLVEMLASVRSFLVEQFEEQNPDAPNIHFVCLVLGKQHFRSEIVVCAAFGSSLDFPATQVETEFGGESKVHQFELFVLSDENIFGLDVSVDDALGVDVLGCF